MRARALVRSLVAPPVLAIFLSSCCCFGGAQTLCAESCRARGECSLRTERAGDGAYRCYAGSDSECAASEACTSRGQCFAAEDGACVAQHEVASRACAISSTCRTWGGCHPREGLCEPTSEDDCRASLGCVTQGRCSFDASHHSCFPSEADCAHTTGCEIEGLCTYAPSPLFGYGSCALTAQGSCEHTLACRLDGRCAARPLEGCSEGCRVFYCGRPESLSAPAPCTEQSGNALLDCEPDGRCIRDATGACVHVPR